MRPYSYDKCDGDGCGVTSDAFPFPHEPGCKYGTGDLERDRQIQRQAHRAAEQWQSPQRTGLKPKE